MRRTEESGRQRWSPTSPPALLLLCKSVSPSQGRVGVHPRAARVRRHGFEKHPEPRSVSSPSGAQSSEWNQYRERETDAGSPNLALSLQARWPPTHTVIQADTHTNTYWHTAMLSFAQSQTHTHTHSWLPHTYTCMCLCVWFSSRPGYFGAIFYNPNRPQLFFPADGKGPCFVFSPTFAHKFSTCVCPCHLPPLYNSKISNTYKNGLPPPEQLIAYSTEWLERGKPLYHVPLCSTTLHQKLTPAFP